MMRPDGHTVHASPIENIISAHSKVKSCAAVGLSLEGGSGTIPTAFVVPSDNAGDMEKLTDELNSLCLSSLPERDVPLAYVIIDAIPYTLMGKVDYKKLEGKHINKVNPYVKEYTFIDINGNRKD